MAITEHDQLLGIEVRHLAALAAIARTSSFSAAAKELGYAQSAVSQQIATLERAVGHRLVERPGGPRPVTLTEAGLLVLRHAEQITARLGAVRADLDALEAGEVGTLRVGIFQSASSRILPAVMARYRAEWPSIEVELTNELDCANLDRAVLSGQLDLAFTDATRLAEPLGWAHLITDPYVVIVPPSSPLAARRELALSILHGADLVGQRPGDTCTVRIEAALERARVVPRVVFRSDDNLTVQRLVAVGLGCAIVCRLAVEPDVPGADVAMLPLVDAEAFERQIVIAWHADRYRSRAAEAFVAVAQEVAAGLPSAAFCATAG